MTTRKRSDRGQAFPIYIMMVAGLLFLALVFFTVGKASATRNGAQGAADAAALAAAQEARDELGPAFVAALLLPDGLDDFFGDHVFSEWPCLQAQRFAAENDSDVLPGSCHRTAGYGQHKFTVTVETRYTVGDSILPGTEERHATATATAVVESRCTFKPDKKDEPGEGGAGSNEDDDQGKDKPGPLTFECDGRDGVIINPLDPDVWEEFGEVFFAVHLID
ncbi:pilus assembly protein TadG-related protein [Streptomyces sp. NPDC007861]|uniref:pilus assembly protein TadG-related protein n=1 Tax=Streptomyces sp. NPDC007861 TaxID=3154893 RepID=UPI0033EFA924